MHGLLGVSAHMRRTAENELGVCFLETPGLYVGFYVVNNYK
jgi:hypothetical protein